MLRTRESEISDMSSSAPYRGRHRKQSEPVFAPLAAATTVGAVAISGAGIALGATAPGSEFEPVVLTEADHIDLDKATRAVDDAREAWLNNAAAADDPSIPQLTQGASAMALKARGQVADLQSQLDKAVKAHADWQAEQEAMLQRNAEQEQAIADQEAAATADESSPEALVSNTIMTAANISDGVARPAEGTFTSGFGPRWGSFHAGIDIANALGTPIYAAMAGTVIDSGPASGFGQWIRIQHDDGTITVYGHMQTLGVSVGERVKAGQYIAGMGSMGFATGSHLHFEVHPGGGAAVDPQPWLAARGIKV